MTQEELLSLRCGDSFRIKSIDQILLDHGVKTIEELKEKTGRVIYVPKFDGTEGKILPLKKIEERREFLYNGKNVKVVSGIGSCYIYFDFEIEFPDEQFEREELSCSVPFDSLL